MMENKNRTQRLGGKLKLLKQEICNCCGGKLDFFDIQQNFTIHKRIGYGSKYDGCVIECKLCCSCFDKMIGACKESPIIEEE